MRMLTQAQTAQKARFAGFKLDLRSSELRRGDRCTRLQGQPFQVLRLLLEQAGEVVTREDFRSLLWPGETFVDFDHGLNKAVSKLRDALDPGGSELSLIQTLPKRGYRLVAEVHWIAPPETPRLPEPASNLKAETAPVLDPVSAAARRDASAPTRPSFVRIALWSSLGIVALGALLWAGRWLSGQPHARPVVQSLAVLPLQNLSANPQEDYFADGMTDELITDLSHVHSLRVISHASVVGLKGSHLSLPEIADQLHVDAVVEGTTLRSQQKVRINVQLVAAHPEQHLWAAHYERNLDDAITLQNEIAAAAVAQMQSKITPEEHAQLQTETPVNPEAHDECLRGRFLLEEERPDQVIKAIPHFQRAVSLAPTDADAYALLGEGLAYEGVYGIRPIRAVVPEAVADSVKAIHLDPRSAEAYEALGMSLTLAKEWQRSEAMLRRSLEIQPNNPRAAEELAILLDMRDRGEEAVRIMRQSAAANPVSVRSQRMYANVLYRARHFDEAIAQARHTLGLDPERPLAYFILGSALAAKGRYDEADQAFRHLPNDHHLAIWLAAVRGDKKPARRLLARYPAEDQVALAMTEYILGSRVRGLERLDKLANEQWEIGTYFLNCDAFFDPMRDDPGFQAILRKAAMPQ